MITCNAQITHDQAYVPCTTGITSDQVGAIPCEAEAVGLGDAWIAESIYDPETQTTRYRPYSWQPVSLPPESPELDGHLVMTVGCNGFDVTEYVHSLHITKTRNAVGLCSLQVSDVTQFARGNEVTVTITIDKEEIDISGLLYKGYVETREISPHGTGTIRCADGLRELRDSVFTESFTWLEDDEESETVLMPKLEPEEASVAELAQMVADYEDIMSDLGDALIKREISFLNANRLSVLQTLAEEYGFSLFEDYQTGFLHFRTGWGPILGLEDSEYDWAIDAGIDEDTHAETGAIVSYEKGNVEYPETEIREGTIDSYETINTSEWTKAFFPEYEKLLVKRTVWKDTLLGGILVNREEDIYERRYRDNRAWHEDLDFDSKLVLVRKVRYTRTSDLGYTVQEQTVTQERDVTRYEVWWKEGPAQTFYYVTYFEVSDWETVSKNTVITNGTTDGGVTDRTTVTERRGDIALTLTEQWEYNRRGGVDYYSRATYEDGTTIVRTETGVQPPGVPIPTGRWKTEEGTGQSGSTENPRMITANYVSNSAIASAYAKRVWEMEIQADSGHIVLPYVLPSLKPGDRVTTGTAILAGKMLGIEQIQMVIDFENLEVHQRLDVRLL